MEPFNHGSKQTDEEKIENSIYTTDNDLIIGYLNDQPKRYKSMVSILNSFQC